jgi:diguanylate cyclase (GGDEF)-like protein
MAWHDRLSLKARLFGGFGTLIAVAIGGGAIAAIASHYARESVFAMFDHHAKVIDLSDKALDLVHKARHHEGEFLAARREISLETARSRHVPRVAETIGELRQTLKELRGYVRDAATLALLDVVEAQSAAHEKSFQTLVERYDGLGNFGGGAEGELGAAAWQIEAFLRERRLERLAPEFLRMRQHEKDYLLRNEDHQAENLRKASAAFVAGVKAAKLPADGTIVLEHHAVQYLAAFERYADLRGKFDAAVADARVSLELMEPTFEQIHTRGREFRGVTRNVVINATRVTTWGAVFVSILLAAFGITVAVAISRSISRSVRASVAFAQQVANGDFGARLPASGAGELAALATALNDMTDALDRAQREQQARADELARANQALQTEAAERERAQGEITRLNADLEERVAQRTAQIEAANRSLAERNQEIALLSEMSQVLQSCMTEQEAFRTAPRFCERLYPGTAGALYVTRASRDQVELVASWGEHGEPAPFFRPPDCWALRRGRPHEVRKGNAEVVCPHVQESSIPVGPYLCIPLMAHGETLGLFHIAFPGESRAGAADEIAPTARALAATLAEQLASAFANLKLRESLRQQSIRDALTGLFNRRFLEESLQREFARAQRSRKPLAAIMLDVDHFKRFNDTFGHEAGDLVLREVGALLRRQVRGGDIACRFGGEEFLMLLPETTFEVARARAEQLREAVHELRPVQNGQALGTITISLGIALFPDHGDTPASLIQAADAALYRAKKAGRDRVVASEA